jgi:hypothetical protein
MTSLQTSQKQHDNDAGYFITLNSLIGLINARTEPSPAGSNTGVNGGAFSTAQWCFWGAGGTSTINAAGRLLKDMGRTIVSSNRVFRKVQAVVDTANTRNTSGVGGQAGTSPSADYFTGYIELGFDGSGTPAPVARFGR